MGRQGVGVFLNLRLDCHYEGLRYIPLLPKLESHTVLAWKKNQMMSPALRAFVDFSKAYINRISSDEK